MRLKISLFIIVLNVLVISNIEKVLGQTTTIIGTGTMSDYIYGPIYNANATSDFHFSRYAYLYTKQELGIPEGSLITHVGWYKTSNSQASDTGITFFDVYMENTNDSVFTEKTAWEDLTENATQSASTVFRATDDFPKTNNWVMITLDSCFKYTGQVLTILTDWDKSAMNGNGSESGGGSLDVLNWQYGDIGEDRTLGIAGPDVVSIDSLQLAGYGGSNRPNLRIIYMPPATIINHPVSKTACEDEEVVFNVATSNSSAEYQWQISTDDGTTFTDIDDFTLYRGVNTDTLKVLNIAIALSGNQYRCLLSLCDQLSSTTLPATLTVNTCTSVEHFSVNSIQIHPNPATNLLKIDIPLQHEQIIFEMNNMLGDQVMSKKLSGGQHHVILLDGIPRGIYMIHLQDIQANKKSIKLALE